MIIFSLIRARVGFIGETRRREERQRAGQAKSPSPAAHGGQ